MTLKKLLNIQELRFKIKSFKKQPFVEDILVYGSIVRGKIDIRDIDFAIVLNKNTSLKIKLELAQEFKEEISFLPYETDVKAIDFSDLKDPDFLARQGILREGFSITKKKFFCELFGFKPYTLFNYSLKGIKLSKQKMIYYALRGRRGAEGLIESKNSISLATGLIQAPLEHTYEFQEFFTKNKIDYKTILILIPQ